MAFALNQSHRYLFLIIQAIQCVMQVPRHGNTVLVEATFIPVLIPTGVNLKENRSMLRTLTGLTLSGPAIV